MKRKAVFLDRDGTINEDIGYLFKIEDLAFIPGALEAMRMLQKDFFLFIITNQQGISQKVFSESDFIGFNNKYLGMLEKNGVRVTDVYYCPHTKEDKCSCRKPGAYFIEKAKKQYSLDIRNSYIIGDHSSDVEIGSNIDIKTIYVLTGHGGKHADQLKAIPDHIAEDLYQAALWIKKAEKEGKE